MSLRFIRVSSCLRNGRNVWNRHTIASSNKNDVLDRKILSHNDWQIVTDVSKDHNAFIFRVKLALTTVLYNCVNEGIRKKIRDLRDIRGIEGGSSTSQTLGKDSKIFIYTSISKGGFYNTVYVSLLSTARISSQGYEHSCIEGDFCAQ
jgi:hypothetical protein